MKKSILVIPIIISAVSQLNSLDTLRHLFGQDTPKNTTSTRYPGSHRKVDTVAFWNKAVQLFDRAGYGPGTEFGDHASENLKRVETMHRINPNKLAALARSRTGVLSQGPREEKPELKTERKHKKKETPKEEHKKKHKKTKREVEHKKPKHNKRS